MSTRRHDDFAREIEAHIAIEADRLRQDGLSTEEAERIARFRFGNRLRTEERFYESQRVPWLDDFRKDLRYAFRILGHAPIFAATVITTLALGIGATSAIFSVVYSVLLRPLPYPDPQRLVRMGETTSKNVEGISVTWMNLAHWRRDSHTFEDMAGFEMAHFSLTGRGEPVFTRAGLVDCSFFRLIGANAALGRVFNDGEDRSGAAPVLVVSHDFWVEKLGSDPRILGQILNLNGKAWQVIGVLGPAPQFFPKRVDFYVPLGAIAGNTTNRAGHGSIRVLGKLKPGVTLKAAVADLNGIMKHLAQIDPGPEDNHRAFAQPFAESIVQNIRPTILMLFGAVIVVLLIACANVASLNLARSTQRLREIAIRASIGAGRRRLARQLLTENVLLAALGGALGLLTGYGGVRALIHEAPAGIPRLSEVRIDAHVLLFAAAVTLATGLLIGLAPVLLSGKVDLVAALHNDSRSATGTRSSQSLRSSLVIGEIALTLALSFSASLLIRSLLRTETRDPGFEPKHLLALELILPSGAYKESIQSFYDRLTAEMAAVPGVSDASMVYSPPSTGDNGDWFYSVVGAPVPSREDVPVSLFNRANPTYFRTMRIPLREGRAFSTADRSGAPLVAIVNETFARKWWPHGPAVGHLIKSGGPYIPGPLYRIVGVVGDVSQLGLDTNPLPEIYLPFAESPSEAMVAMIRTPGNPEQLTSAVRKVVSRLDPLLPIQSLGPFTQTVASTLGRRRFMTLLLTLFALLATVLAMVGMACSAIG